MENDLLPVNTPSHFIFDIETDGLLDTVTQIHSLVLRNVATGELISCSPHGEYQAMSEGLGELSTADAIIGHNIIDYDIPVLEKLGYPILFDQKVVDTLVCARLLWPDIKESDFKRFKSKRLPGKYIGSHSLKAWGYRLGIYKGDFNNEDTDWTCWTPEMQEYCEQDTRVTHALYNQIVKKMAGQEKAVELEHSVACLCSQITRNGFPFDVQKAEALTSRLRQKAAELNDDMREFFPPWEEETDFTPKRDNKTKGYVKGKTIKKRKMVDFNPSSRDHIALKFKEKYNWEPKEKTDSGKPKVDDEVLSSLDFPEAGPLSELFLVNKRIAMLAEGQQAWLKLVNASGFIHHAINPNGAVTGRATHRKPNLAQVPGASSAYGPECRELFTCGHWDALLGTDKSGLELRCLGHYLAPFDGGSYSTAVVEGRKEDGTDVHSLTCIAIGKEPTKTYDIFGTEKTGRDIAKTYIYALLYGAGAEKLGRILGGDAKTAATAAKSLRETMPALAKLKAAIQKRLEQVGYLRGLDGRHLRVRKTHSSLNTLLQSAGAILCKQWIIYLDNDLKTIGLKHGWHGDYAFLAWVHDELQIAVRHNEQAERIGELSIAAAEKAGKFYKLNCPLTAEYSIGATWKDTH